MNKISENGAKMKYHTTILTAVISFLILSVFVFVSIFACFELNIDSPGYLVLSLLEDRVPGPQGYSISYSTIDRIMKDSVTVNDIRVETGDFLITADGLTVYGNPFSLAKSVLTGKGRIEADAVNVNLTLKEKEQTASVTMTPEELLEAVKSLDDMSDVLAGSNLRKLSYSFNVKGMSIFSGDAELRNLKCNLQLDEDLSFRSFVAEVPSFTYEGLDISALALKTGHDGSLYYIALSGDRVLCTAGEFSVDVAEPRISMEFPAFSSLELYDLPLVLSAEKTSLSIGNINAETDEIRLESADSVLYFSVGELRGGMETYRVLSAPVSGSFDYTREDGAFLSLSISESISLLEGETELVKVTGTDINATYLTALTVSADLKEAEISELGQHTSDLAEGVTLHDISLSIQHSARETYADAALSLGIKSGNSLLDGSSFLLRGNVYLEGSTPAEFSIALDDIRISALPDMLSARLALRDKVYTASVSYQDMVTLSGEYGETYRGELTLSGFRADRLTTVIDAYFPMLKRYIGSDTLMNGYMRIISDRDGRGSLYSSIALDGIHFNENVFGLASGLSASVTDRGIEDIRLTVTSELLRFSYDGSLSFSTFLPEGSFAISRTGTGKELFALSIIPGERQYEFSARFLERTEGYLKGKINWARKDIIQALGEIKSSASIYPFDLSIDLSDRRVDLLSDNVLLTADYSDELDIYLSLDSFPLPVNDISVKPITIDGAFSYYFNFAEQISLATITDLAVRNIRYIPSNPEVIINGSYSDMVLNLDRITWSDPVSELTGSFVWPMSENRMAFTLGNGSERINASFMKDGELFTGMVRIGSLKLDRFGFTGAALDAGLVGKGENTSDFDFSGDISVRPSDGGDQFALSGNITLNDRYISLTGLDFKYGPLSVYLSQAGYTTQSEEFTGELDMKLVKANYDRDYLVTSSLSFAIPVGSHASVTDAFFTSLDTFRKSFSARLKIDTINIDDFIRVGERDLELSYSSDNGFSFSGSLAEGYFSTETMMTDLSVDLLPVAALRVSGSADPGRLDLDIRDLKFNLGSINFTFPFPIIWFSDNGLVEGDLKLFGTLRDTHLYGNLFTHGLDMEVWWLQKDTIKISDIHFSLIDNYLYAPRTPVLLIDKNGGPVKTVDVDLEAQLSSSNIVDFFGLNVWIEKGQDVFVRIPIESQNMQIDGEVYGHFTYYTDLIKNYLGGEIKADTGVFSYGMDPLPSWWGSRMLVSNDFDVTLGENMKFLFPLSADPILVAYMKENSHFRFSYDNQVGSIGLDGSLDFRAGEIYYFEKNFFITEGSLRFDNATARRLAPVINLRARLRDYDAEGNKVDIYLVLRNSTLTELNPYFESSPAKDLNEIMSILGDAILPSSTYGEFNLSSVASLVTSGVDVMARMGIIRSSSSADLITTIRNSLGLDMFSLRTNLIENLLLDTIFTSTGQTISPVARYLDKTSIYMGKYLSENFFLQGMIHLSALNSNRNSGSYTTILADDLMVDLEISLEWQNPLGTVSFFTKPRNFSLHNLFDSFGFSFTKTIVF